MFIKSLEASNFRTLENFNVVFNGYYTAISGKNNAGKSNILRAQLQISVAYFCSIGLYFLV